MASEFVRSTRNINDIEKVPFNQNKQNDLLQTKNGDVYVRLSRSYEKITGLSTLEEKLDKHIKEYKSFKKQTENNITNLQTELGEYIQNTDELLQNMEKEHQDKLDKLYMRIKALEDNEDNEEESDV